MSKCCQTIGGLVFHYETFKIVDIKSKKVGALFRVLQLVIFAYALFTIVYKKNYQAHDTAISTVRTKLKGTAFVDFKNFSSLFNGLQVFDPSDYVIPPQESNSFFVMTNMIITPNQTQGKCAEDTKYEDNWCQSDQDCLPALSVVKNGNGVRTGACVHSDQKPSIKVCEIYGWCPTEREILPMPGLNFSNTIPLLNSASKFTVLVKNQIRFPKFNVVRRNIISHNNTKYFNNCTYDKETDPLCPIFKLEDIIKSCGDDFTEVAYRGSTYGILINWDCDLDYSEQKCMPTYSFRRLDDPYAPISPGYNFRFSQYYVVDNKRYRLLTKAYGLRFQVLVHAKAGKFSPEPLFLELGAAIALFAIASWVCDIVVIYCASKRKLYEEHKYLHVDDSDHYEIVVDDEDFTSS